jgi:hypothetical protein
MDANSPGGFPIRDTAGSLSVEWIRNGVPAVTEYQYTEGQRRRYDKHVRGRMERKDIEGRRAGGMMGVESKEDMWLTVLTNVFYYLNVLESSDSNIPESSEGSARFWNVEQNSTFSGDW